MVHKLKQLLVNQKSKVVIDMSEQARENLDRIMKSMEGVPEGIRDVMADKMATYAEGMAAGIEAANAAQTTGG